MKISKTILSLILGIVGVLSLLVCWINNLVTYYGPQMFDVFQKGLESFFIRKHSQIVEMIAFILSWYINLAFLFVLFFAIVGTILGLHGFRENSKGRTIALVGVVINIMNIIFSFLIAWLLFGLARGM